MNGKLREYLKRQGVSDDALDKIEKGQVPDDDALRKRNDNKVDELLRKINDNSHLERIEKIHDQLRKLQEIVTRIEKNDRARASLENFINSGTPIIKGGALADLSAMDLKGTPQ